MKYLLVIASIFFFSCNDKKGKSSADENQSLRSEKRNSPDDEISPLRFDGVYASKKIQTYEGGDYWYYLRFYANGTVISVSSSGTAKEISKWFKRGHEMVSEGEYKIDKSSISFTLKGQNGSVKYKGEIVNEEKLKLHSRSLINDNENNLVFTFEEQ